MTKRNDETYALTSAAIPRLSDGTKDFIQAEIVYKCLEPFGSHQTLEQLVLTATKLKLETTFRSETSTTVRESLIYHLNQI